MRKVHICKRFSRIPYLAAEQNSLRAQCPIVPSSHPERGLDPAGLTRSLAVKGRPRCGTAEVRSAVPPLVLLNPGFDLSVPPPHLPKFKAPPSFKANPTNESPFNVCLPVFPQGSPTILSSPLCASKGTQHFPFYHLLVALDFLTHVCPTATYLSQNFALNKSSTCQLYQYYWPQSSS